jgi:hypothetical protein
MNIFSLIDQHTAEQAEALAPHKNMLDINERRKLSGVAAIPKPVVSTIANWLAYERTEPVNDTFLQSLAI